MVCGTIFPTKLVEIEKAILGRKKLIIGKKLFCKGICPSPKEKVK
jgi:hypothetical protein